MAGEPRRDRHRGNARPRVHSIKFDAQIDDWMESLVELMSRAGLPKAGRSEVVRVGLGEFRPQLAGCSPADTIKFLLDRDTERRLERLGAQDSADTE
jgi:hypothetical protein